MATRLGGVFLASAMGPVRYAGLAIQASRMPQAFEELAPDTLWSALRRGMEQAAKLAGVKPQDVEKVLPMKELEASLEQIKVSHAKALEAWNVHAGQLGGLLKGVADLTVDGQTVLPSSGLARIARKVRRDKAFAVPVQTFADDMLRWEELVEQCRQALEQGVELARAYQRRRIRNAAIIAASAAAAVTAITVMLIVRASRSRIDTALESKDVCAVAEIAPVDLGRGSTDQQQQVAARQQACEAQRALAAHAQSEVQRKEDEAKEAARQQAELEAKCDALAKRILEGKISAEDAAVAGSRAPLLRRIRQKALLPRDLGPERPELPCEGTPAEVKVGSAFIEAAVTSIWQWVGAVDPAEQVRVLLAPHAEEMSERARLALSVRATDAAKRALKKGTPDAIDKALRLCAFAEALAVPGGEQCDALKTLPPPASSRR
jgi:hypothetical protein